MPVFEFFRKSLFLCVLFLLCGAGILRLAPASEFPPVPADTLKVRDGLPNILTKLENGEPVTIAYFGGSITSMPGWRTMTEAWFKETWPNASVTAVDAAIGGTGSELGAYRCECDVTTHKPDLVFVEFAVNDTGVDPVKCARSMEGIVRQIWRAKIETDIAFVYTCRPDFEADTLEGRCPPSVSTMEYVADFYGIPSINFNIPVRNLEQNGKLVFQSNEETEGKIRFSADSIHPLPAGHEIYTETVKRAVLSIQKDFDDGFLPPREKVAERRREKLRSAFTDGSLEDAKMVPVSPDMLSGTGWTQDESDSVKWFKNRMNPIWDANTPGDALSFKFRGTYAALYDIIGPDGGKVEIAVDDEPKRTQDLFDSYCTYHRIAVLTLADNLPADQIHTVTVTVLSEEPDRRPALKDSADIDADLASPKYHGHHLRVGKIMLRGEITE